MEIKAVGVTVNWGSGALELRGRGTSPPPGGNSHFQQPHQLAAKQHQQKAGAESGAEHASRCPTDVAASVN